jgi:hypothetical protein
MLATETVTWSQETSWSGPRSSLNQLDPVGDDAEIPALKDTKNKLNH